VWVTASLGAVRVPTAIALGNFDGVHRGHQRVIEPILVGAAGPLGDRAAPVPTVVSFDPHPQAFFSGQSRSALTLPAEKGVILAELGVQQLVLLPFDRTLAELPPEAFVRSVLLEGLQACTIAVGEDFRFGRDRRGTAEMLRAIAAKWSVPVTIVPLHCAGGDRISSSWIRQCLCEGDIATANRLLGRPYSLMGTVEPGQQLGQKLGFPTANLALSPQKFLPRHGVYGVEVTWADGLAVPGVMNVGRRPTVDGQRVTAEVHLLDWAGDLYGQELTVALRHFLRPERKFDGLDALVAQIRLDCEAARSRWATA